MVNARKPMCAGGAGEVTQATSSELGHCVRDGTKFEPYKGLHPTVLSQAPERPFQSKVQSEGVVQGGSRWVLEY